MRFVSTDVEGVFEVELTFHNDDRGGLGRTYCQQVFADAGIDFTPVQCNLSRNPAKGTLRGMHYQVAPHFEAKVVQCSRGRIFDVAVDLRPEFPTYGKWAGTELSADGDRLFFIPEGCAHGFVTLEPNSNVFYLMGASYIPGTAAGVRWDDPAFGIIWPMRPEVISQRDASFPDWHEGPR